ncbi:hypothetical protein, partial [Caldivirga sp. UBA161]|uniref:hypothetical protein n=1 Tax=Caldivirga sp. UBA161 TaxID=1915569 RepID=UPI0025C426AF
MVKSFTLRVRPIVLKPSVEFLGEEPAKVGYWGFVRSRGDYEGELKAIGSDLNNIVNDLVKEGYSISLEPILELSSMDEFMNHADELRGVHLAILLPIFPIALYQYPERSILTALLSIVDYAAVYDKFSEHFYSGTLFAPPLYQNLASIRPDLARRIVLAEGDLNLVKSTMRVAYALERLKNTTVVMVGEPNYDFGGWATLAKATSMFGFRVKHITYSRFVNDFEAKLKDPEAVKEAGRIANDYVAKGKAEANIRVKYELPEPDEDRRIKAGAYYLTLMGYLKEADSDWATVNCLSVNTLGRVGATPCMAFSIMNDSGLVGTCEADPTAMITHYLLRWIANKPTAFYDPTVNIGEGKLILAHCTSPTRMLGYGVEGFRYIATTHHESNTSVAPKVLYEAGVVTIAGLSHDLSKLLIIRGEATGPTFLRICRNQVEVKVNEAKAALENWQGFHWVM